MKKQVLIISLLIMCFSFISCNSEIAVPNVPDISGNSEIAVPNVPEKTFHKEFSEEEIVAAKKVIEKRLKEFGIGYTMKKLYYDEIETEIRKVYHGENIIVLFSHFETDSSFVQKEENSFAPNTYYEWVWVLKRNDQTGKWEVKDWGF